MGTCATPKQISRTTSASQSKGRHTMATILMTATAMKKAARVKKAHLTLTRRSTATATTTVKKATRRRGQLSELIGLDFGGQLIGLVGQLFKMRDINKKLTN